MFNYLFPALLVVGAAYWLCHYVWYKYDDHIDKNKEASKEHYVTIAVWAAAWQFPLAALTGIGVVIWVAQDALNSSYKSPGLWDYFCVLVSLGIPVWLCYSAYSNWEATRWLIKKHNLDPNHPSEPDPEPSADPLEDLDQ